MVISKRTTLGRCHLVLKPSLPNLCVSSWQTLLQEPLKLSVNPRQPSASDDEREQPVPTSSFAGGRLLLSIPEAAEILSVGRSSLYGLIQRHEIPTVKIGNRRLISSRLWSAGSPTKPRFSWGRSSSIWSPPSGRWACLIHRVSTAPHSRSGPVKLPRHSAPPGFALEPPPAPKVGGLHQNPALALVPGRLGDQTVWPRPLALRAVAGRRKALCLSRPPRRAPSSWPCSSGSAHLSAALGSSPWPTSRVTTRSLGASHGLNPGGLSAVERCGGTATGSGGNHILSHP
jgi:excisionase family DNA binding protein